ncbi:MAG: hypothetical protein M3R52_02680 [Acidobacteriota bacterium]|nr:hypothetical protein [Acidobacteriota bacterium]
MILKICKVLVFFSSLSIVNPISVLAQKGREVKICLVALNDNGKTGKKIGCHDSLVPVTRTIKATVAPFRAALEELLSTPPETGDNPKLLNFWKGRNLEVRSVRFASLLLRFIFQGRCSSPASATGRA